MVVFMTKRFHRGNTRYKHEEKIVTFLVLLSHSRWDHRIQYQTPIPHTPYPYRIKRKKIFQSSTFWLTLDYMILMYAVQHLESYFRWSAENLLMAYSRHPVLYCAV
jgi:hypothetical protein